MHRQLVFASSRARPKASAPEKQAARWVRQLCAGEPAAWTALVEGWGSRLYSYARYSGVSEEEAQSLLTHIFAAVAEAVVGSLPIPNLTVLILTIAYQHILPLRQPTPYHPMETYLQATQGDEEAVRFLNTFHSFTPEVQQILLLYYLCGVSLSEISQIVGQREEIIAKLLHRAQFHLTKNK